MVDYVFVPDNIVFTKGFKNWSILDTLRRKIISLNAEMILFIQRVNGKPVECHESFTKNSDLELYLNLMDNLISEGILIRTNIHPNKYIKKKSAIIHPNEFNAILEIKLSAFEKAKDIIFFANTNNLKFLELRISEVSFEDEVIKLLSYINFEIIASIDLKIDLPDIELSSDFFSKVNKFLEIKAISLYSRNENLSLINISPTYTFKHKLCKERCGQCRTNLFNTSNQFFTESLHHNSCLNRKISIDAEGNIKNCPSMPESFGNIRDTTLMEAIEKPGFKKYWNITKDQIAVCKDCEFRYICTDCRAYKEDPDDDYSKPLKCGYDPYAGVWEEWSTNPLKQKAIDFYGMREIV